MIAPPFCIVLILLRSTTVPLFNKSLSIFPQFRTFLTQLKKQYKQKCWEIATLLLTHTHHRHPYDLSTFTNLCKSIPLCGDVKMKQWAIYLPYYSPSLDFPFSPFQTFSYRQHWNNYQQTTTKMGVLFLKCTTNTAKKMHSAIFLLYKWAIIIFKQKKSFFETFIITTIMHDHTSLYTHSTNVTKHDRSQNMINAIFSDTSAVRLSQMAPLYQPIQPFKNMSIPILMRPSIII